MLQFKMYLSKSVIIFKLWSWFVYGSMIKIKKKDETFTYRGCPDPYSPADTQSDTRGILGGGRTNPGLDTFAVSLQTDRPGKGIDYCYSA